MIYQGLIVIYNFEKLVFILSFFNEDFLWFQKRDLVQPNWILFSFLSFLVNMFESSSMGKNIFYGKLIR